MCAELRNDCSLKSAQRLATALKQGTAATKADLGFIAYTRAIDCGVPENDWNGLHSTVRDAVICWQDAVLYPAQVIRKKLKTIETL